MKIQILTERHNEQALTIINLKKKITSLENKLNNYNDDLPTLKSTKSNKSLGE